MTSPSWHVQLYDQHTLPVKYADGTQGAKIQTLRVKWAKQLCFCNTLNTKIDKKMNKRHETEFQLLFPGILHDIIITYHLADTFIQSNLQLIRLSRRHTPWSNVGLRALLKGPTAVLCRSYRGHTRDRTTDLAGPSQVA